jgi:hypothetical protein
LNIGGKGRRKETTRKAKTWMDNIKIYLREMGCGSMDWIDLIQDME